MKFADINKAFTNKVTEYISKGYTINAGTMSGSQGEIAKVDMTDGKTIIRIVLGTERERYEDEFLGIECVELLVGEASADMSRYHVRPNRGDRMDVIWIDNLTVIERVRFYQVGENRNGDKFYGTIEEAAAARKKQLERWRAKDGNHRQAEDVTDQAMDVALKVIRGRLGIVRVVRSKVKVTRCRGQYTISYCGKSFRIGKERRAA